MPWTSATWKSGSHEESQHDCPVAQHDEDRVVESTVHLPIEPRMESAGLR
jgi:hypothetical protein